MSDGAAKGGRGGNLQPRVRYTGAAVSYNVAYAVFAGTAPPLAQYLTNEAGLAAPAIYATVVFLVLGVASAFVVPETARLDLVVQQGDIQEPGS